MDNFGSGMAGSFKSMVWDYYLPTDMHEASFLYIQLFSAGVNSLYSRFINAVGHFY